VDPEKNGPASKEKKELKNKEPKPKRLGSVAWIRFAGSVDRFVVGGDT